MCTNFINVRENKKLFYWRGLSQYVYVLYHQMNERVYSIILLPLFYFVNVRCSVPSFLIVGDSLMEKQAGALRSSESPFMAATTYVPMLFPTSVSAKGAIIQYMASKFDVIYINFGVLHMLHIHPVRPFVLEMNDEGYTADFLGFLFLESWMKSELSIYKRAAKKVIVMTPNRVCESKFIGPYDYFINNNTNLSIRKCIEWISSVEEGRIEIIKANRMFGPSIFGNLSDPRVVSDICTQGRFNSVGSFLVTERMKKVVRSMNFPIGLVDSYALTYEMGCNHTKDGRHYSDEVMVKRLAELRQVMIKMH